MLIQQVGPRNQSITIPAANVQPYVHVTVIPTGVLYLKIFTTQRTASAPPILDAFLYEYDVPVTAQSVATEPVPIKLARDHFSIHVLGLTQKSCPKTFREVRRKTD